MKQVTGNNSIPSPDRVSIQLSLDGHSFSRPELDRIPETTAPIDIELLLPGTMLVPEKLFEEKNARLLLAANGIPTASDDGFAVCRPRENEEPETVAIVAIDAKMMQRLRERFPSARFSSPLLHRPSDRQKCVWICRREGLLYIKVYHDGRLQMAEVIPSAEEPETGYFIERLGRVFQLDKYDLRIEGDNVRELRKWIGKHFGKVLCE